MCVYILQTNPDANSPSEGAGAATNPASGDTYTEWVISNYFYILLSKVLHKEAP